MKFHLLFVPLVAVFLALNAFGGIVSGIWLAIIGQWWALGIGLIGLGSHFFLGLLVMPGMLIATPAISLQEKGSLGLAQSFAGLSTLYVSAVVGIWGVIVFTLFIAHATSTSVTPLLIWSYNVATGPWAFLAWYDQRSGGNEYSAMALFFLQAGYIVSAVLLLMGANLRSASFCILGAMAINWLVQMVVLRVEMRAYANFSPPTNHLQ